LEKQKRWYIVTSKVVFMRKALQILGLLADTDIEWLAREGKVNCVPAGTILIRERIPIDCLYILLDGQLSVRVGPDGGSEIAILQCGDIVGEISFVDSRPPSASVVAVQDSFLLALPRSTLAAKLELDVAFAARFYHAVASFLADRLYVTVGRFGYGSYRQDAEISKLGDDAIEELSLAAIRFDKLLKHLRGDSRGGSFAQT
jgi:CRP-like cAMP-binding protein